MVAEAAFAAHLGSRIPSEKRTYEPVSFHAGTVAVTQAMMVKKLNPERARVRVVLRVAAEQFGIIRARHDVAPAA